MRKLLQNTLSMVLLSLCFMACKKDSPIEEVGLEATGDSQLIEYLRTFEREASARNVTLPDDPITVTYVNDLDGGCTRAWTNYQNTNTRRVEIEQSNGCWSVRSDYMKEALVFHEFGHALLERPYDNISFLNGYPSTIMCGDNCLQFNIYYHPNMRDYYLDELFDPNVGLPDWAILSEAIAPAYEENFDEGALDWELKIRNDENNNARWKTSLLEENSGNRRLRVTTDEVPEFPAFVVVEKTFNLGDFPDCTALRASMTVTFNEPMSGDIAIGLSARTQLPDGTEDLFVYHIEDTRVDESTTEITLNHSILCLPETTDQATVSFHLRSFESKLDVSVDNVFVDHWQ